MVTARIRHLTNIKGDKGAKGQKGDPGSFASASAETVPATEPASVTVTGPETARHLHVRIPQGPAGPGGVEGDAAVATYVGSRATATGGEVTKRVGAEFSVLEFGAVGDGTADDRAAFLAARDAAGPNGVVRVPSSPASGQTRYLISGVRPDLSGTQWRFDPDVTLVMDASPDLKEFGFLTPVTIDNPVHKTTLRKAPAVDVPAAAAIAASARPQSIDMRAVDFTTWERVKINAGATAPVTFGTPSSTVTPASVTWSTFFADGLDGIFTKAEVGAYYQFAFECDAAGADRSISLALLSEQNHYLALTFGAGQVTLTLGGSASFGAGRSFTVAGTYGMTSGWGGVIVGLRVISRTRVEWYVNDFLLYTQDLLQPVGRVGAVANATDVTSKRIRWATVTRGHQPKASRQCRVAVIGDSIPFSAWNPVSMVELLPIAAAALPGGGNVEVTANLAVSGSQSSDWAAGGAYDVAGQDFSGVQYVLVMLGTNDVQSAVPVQDYLDRMAYICSQIVAQGAVPVLGVFPIWVSKALTGLDQGVDTTNPGRGANHRAAIQHYALSLGYPVALVSEAIGASWRWYADNIHPDERGQALMAIAFAQAIARHQGSAASPVVAIEWGGWQALPTAWLRSGWAAYTGSTLQYRRHLVTGAVELRGRIAGGTAASAIQLPEGMRPAVPVATAVRAITNGVDAVGMVSVSTAGLIAVNIGSSGTTGVTFTELAPLSFETT